MVFDKTRCFGVNHVNRDFLIIHHPQYIHKELWVKSDQDILAFLLDINLFLHRTNIGIDTKFHIVIRKASALEIQDDCCRIISKLCSGHGNMYAMIKEVLRRMDWLPRRATFGYPAWAWRNS